MPIINLFLYSLKLIIHGIKKGLLIKATQNYYGDCKDLKD